MRAKKLPSTTNLKRDIDGVIIWDTTQYQLMCDLVLSGVEVRVPVTTYKECNEVE